MKNYDVIVIGGGTAVYGIPFPVIVSGHGDIINGGMVQELINRLCIEDFSFGIARSAFLRKQCNLQKAPPEPSSGCNATQTEGAV